MVDMTYSFQVYNIMIYYLYTLQNEHHKKISRWEGGSGWGIHVNPWLIHVNV